MELFHLISLLVVFSSWTSKDIFTEATTGSSYSHAARVLELTDRFPEIRKEGVWLVKFYAPWCGHCKKLEPVFNHVAQSLYDSEIRVGRIDCTRYPAIASQFRVSGYPTIMFMKGDVVHAYRGERTREEIVKYAKRMNASPINELYEEEELQDVLSKEEVIFGYVGEREGPLWDAFNQTALDFQSYTVFYAFNESQIPTEFLKDNKPPQIFVHKENENYFFEYEPSPTDVEDVDEWTITPNETQVLSKWVSRERFPSFLKISRNNFQSLLSTEKFLVMAVLEEDRLGRLTADMTEFKEMLNSIVMHNREKYRGLFQFGWIGAPDLANSIAMTKLPTPSLMIINSTTFHHHIPDDDPIKLTHEAIMTFLDQVVDGAVTVYGGNSFIMRLLRSLYEGKTSLVDMWTGNPILTTLIFGLPLGFLSLIFYSICCADMMDAPDEDDDETDRLHEKKE